MTQSDKNWQELSWQEIVISYVEHAKRGEKQAVREALRYATAEAIFLAWAISRGFPVLVTRLKSAPAIKTPEEIRLVTRMGGYVPVFGAGDGKPLSPLEMAAHDGQYQMFLDLEHRPDADYHLAMVQACENGCTDLVKYMLNKRPPVINVTEHDYVSILDPGSRWNHTDVLILLQAAGAGK
jgi:hypothetical protein